MYFGHTSVHFHIKPPSWICIKPLLGKHPTTIQDGSFEYLVYLALFSKITPTLQQARKFKPHPQNRIMVCLKSSFQNFQEAPYPFYMDVPSMGINCPGILILRQLHLPSAVLQALKTQSALKTAGQLHSPLNW